MIWDIGAGSNHSIFLMDHADMKDSKPDVFYVGKHPWLVADFITLTYLCNILRVLQLSIWLLSDENC